MWDAVAVDPKRDLMMFGVGNPDPDLYGDFRKGTNLYTVSIVEVARQDREGRLVLSAEFLTTSGTWTRRRRRSCSTCPTARAR